MLLSGEQYDVTVEIFVAQCFCGLGACEAAADDGEGGRRCHAVRPYSPQLSQGQGMLALQSVIK
jgi:hypothetical protein